MQPPQSSQRSNTISTIANDNYDHFDNYIRKKSSFEKITHNENYMNKMPTQDENNNYEALIGELMLGYNSDQESKDSDDDSVSVYHGYKFGDCIPRSGKVFSYTFWRTKANSDVFWSIQGNNEMEGAIGGVWVATQYFGNPASASRFRQEITLTHPTARNIQMTYASTLAEGENCVFISKAIVHHFRNEDNSIDFDFRIVRRGRKTRRRRKKTF